MPASAAWNCASRPTAAITDEQAAEIALAVKNVAQAMDERGQSGSYGKVYSELYRRYRISSYKNLPRARYDEVLGWLSKWYNEVVGESLQIGS
jgi:ORF6C domain